jgi:hypothetical protein
MASSTPVGEPYALAGRRMPFVSWRYVRPGGLAWVDDRGNNVTVQGDLDWGQARLVLTDSPRGIRLVTQPARHVGPILRAETPWEQNGFPILTTVIQDGATYRAWGTIGGWGDLKDRGPSYFCYFESDDGTNWRRPECGVVEYQGSRKNNLLCREGHTVFVDPSAPPAERYKWIGLVEYTPQQVEAYKQRRTCGIDAKAFRPDKGNITFGIQGAVSPDGLRWTVLAQPLALIFSDTQICAYYDAGLKKYVAYVREWAADPKAPAYRGDDDPRRWNSIARRSIGRAETSDFREFPLSEVILEPPAWLPPSQVLYSPCRTTYPGAPDQHLMFPVVWDQATDRMHTRIAVSRDGRTWDWLGAGEPPPFDTAEQGQWDGGCLGGAPNLIELPNGDFALPYVGFNLPHKYPRRRAERASGLAVWPKGRIAGIRADERGEFATVAVVPPGKKVLLNAVTSDGGSIRVEAADLDGHPLPGRSFDQAVALSGDLHGAPVRWREQADLGGAPDPVMLRLKLERATVYHVEFA